MLFLAKRSAKFIAIGHSQTCIDSLSSNELSIVWRESVSLPSREYVVELKTHTWCQVWEHVYFWVRELREHFCNMACTLQTPHTLRLSTCSSCLQWVSTSVQQVRGAKKLPRSPTITVQLLQDVPKFGRKGDLPTQHLILQCLTHGM